MPKPEIDINSLIERNNGVTPVMPLPANLPLKPPKLCIDDLRNRRVTHQTNHPAPKSVVRILGSNYCNAGMISALTGPPKSGKTTVIGFILATCFTHFSNTAQSLEVESDFSNGRDVVYMDFEQHVSSTQDLQDKVLRYAALDKTPDNLHIWNLLEMSLEERSEAIDIAFDSLNMHLLIIDGLADILTSVNDEEKSNALIERLALLASKNNTAVIVVIHENKGGGTVRGHLGSQIERKCAGLISIKKDRERKVHSIESRLIRIGDDFDTVYFHYSEEQNRMVLLDALAAEEMKEAAKAGTVKKDEDPEFLAGLMKLAFSGAANLDKKELKAGVLKHDSSASTEKTALRRITGAVKLGIIRTDDERVYVLTDEPPF